MGNSDGYSVARNSYEQHPHWVTSWGIITYGAHAITSVRLYNRFTARWPNPLLSKTARPTTALTAPASPLCALHVLSLFGLSHSPGSLSVSSPSLSAILRIVPPPSPVRVAYGFYSGSYSPARSAIRSKAESSGIIAVSAFSGSLSGSLPARVTDALGAADGCSLPVRARCSTSSVTWAVASASHPLDPGIGAGLHTL